MAAVIANLAGGLGNQLFQFANGFAVSKKMGCELFLYRDDIRTRINHKTDIEENFESEFKFVSKAELRTNFGSLNSSTLMRELYQKSPLCPTWVMPKEYFYERWVKYRSLNPVHGSGIYLHGYWQSPRYFEEYREKIISSLAFRLGSDLKQRNDEKINKYRYVTVHIRGGDYLTRRNKKIYNQLSSGYYDSACRYFSERYSDVKFLLITNDEPYARSIFAESLYNIELFEAGSSEDFYMMTKAFGNIIANSTYSWWGAWLNQNAKSIVGPKHWYAEGHVPQHAHSILPNDWICI